MSKPGGDGGTGLVPPFGAGEYAKSRMINDNPLGGYFPIDISLPV